MRAVPRGELPGADRRYAYAHWRDLPAGLRNEVRRRWMPGPDHLPYEEYFYPVKKNGGLADARRFIPMARAQELYELWTAKEVMES